MNNSTHICSGLMTIEANDLLIMLNPLPVRRNRSAGLVKGEGPKSLGSQSVACNRQWPSHLSADKAEALIRKQRLMSIELDLVHCFAYKFDRE